MSRGLSIFRQDLSKNRMLSVASRDLAMPEGMNHGSPDEIIC